MRGVHDDALVLAPDAQLLALQFKNLASREMSGRAAPRTVRRGL